ncbi:MAG: FtsW/RodA/SpoVE family cell cycle protein [Patescibacteria group bacterium]
MKKRPAHVRNAADKTFLFLLSILLAFGTLMIYDATAVYSRGELGGAFKLVTLHITWLLIGALCFFLFYKLDYHKLQKPSIIIFSIAALMLVVLAFAGQLLPCNANFIFAPCINGANRWFFLNPAPLPSIPFLGVLGFQPSEFAKLAMIIYLAVIIAKNEGDDLAMFVAAGVISGLVFLLILAQPNMSTAVLLLSIGMTMFFASDASIRPLLTTLPFFAGAAFFLMFGSEYRRQRFKTFLGSEDLGSDSLGSGYHIQQILIALGSGGLFGLGPGQSIQKFKYLPEVYADSIFAIIGEELGFIGTTVFIIFYTLFIYKGFDIAKKAPDLLGRLLAVGIVSWLTFQFFINIAAMLKLIPLTGVPLPLVSYGGSSTVFSLAAIGILSNVSRQSSV